MFYQHFRMQENDVIRYIREKLGTFFDADDQLECKEIGDGNVNYVFRVYSLNRAKSIIVKQADFTTRWTSHALGIDRNRIEAEILKVEAEYAADMVPQVYLYDPVMSCVVMEDLSNHRIMRYALIDEEIYPGFAEKIALFMAETLANTTDFVLSSREKKELVQRFSNPDMCDISERLVYTDPYTKPVSKGDVADANIPYINDDLQQDSRLKLAVAQLKMDFMNNAQALIHGDLHTGSIFIKQGSVKVIDPEFAFFGPIGYDVGNVIANLAFAWVRASVVNTDDLLRRNMFLAWIRESIEKTVDIFKHDFHAVISKKSHDLLFSSQVYQTRYMEQVLADTAGVTGLEINRRIIGRAKVKDITSITDQASRAKVERVLMDSAREFITNAHNYQCGINYINTIEANLKSSMQ